MNPASDDPESGGLPEHPEASTPPAAKPTPGTPERSDRKLPENEVDDGPGGHLIASYSYRGPLPPPEQLARYEDVLPGAADRVFSGWEDERQHRHMIERRVLDEEAEARRAHDRFQLRGQLGAVTTVVVFGGVSTIAILAGHPVEGAIIAGTTAASIATAFLGKQILQRKPGVEKRSDAETS